MENIFHLKHERVTSIFTLQGINFSNTLILTKSVIYSTPYWKIPINVFILSILLTQKWLQ